MAHDHPGSRPPLRTLSDHAVLRYATFTALYVAQGLPAGFLTVAVPGWLASQGHSPAQIGWYLGAVTLPLSFKFVVGPLMDRFTFLPMGRRRPWVIGAQLGLLAAVGALAVLPASASRLDLLMACGVAITLCAAVQDVGVDGMAIDILPDGERTRANGLMFGGKALGTAAAAAAGGWLLSSHGVRWAALALSLAIGVIALLPIVLRERPGERLLPWSPGTAADAALRLQLHGFREIVGSLWRGLLLPASLGAGAMIFVFRFGEGLLRAVLPVAAVTHLGWSNAEYSGLMGSAGLAAGMAGMLLAATVVERIGRLRTVLIANVLLIGLHLGAALWPQGLALRGLFIAYVVSTQVLDVTVAVAILTVFMGLCWQRVAATQFTIYLSLANLGYAAGAAALGPLHAGLPLEGLFLVLAGASLGAIALLRTVDLRGHAARLRRLDTAPDETAA